MAYGTHGQTADEWNQYTTHTQLCCAWDMKMKWLRSILLRFNRMYMNPSADRWTDGQLDRQGVTNIPPSPHPHTHTHTTTRIRYPHGLLKLVHLHVNYHTGTSRHTDIVIEVLHTTHVLILSAWCWVCRGLWDCLLHINNHWDELMIPDPKISHILLITHVFVQNSKKLWF